MIAAIPALPRWLAAFALLAAAHVGAWASGRVLVGRWPAPVDAGATLRDGRRLFGEHKTWRGLLLAGLLCAAVAPLVGYGARLGVQLAALAMGADLATSLLKRRLNLSPGREVPGLDQIPEALVPLLVLARPLGIDAPTAWLLTGIFVVLDLAALPLRHRRRDGAHKPS
jgi:CDP-2,3-bis-(O-geranylgeranyl)-sn-glycerol synthase